MVHYWFDFRKIQKNNNLTDEQRRQLSDHLINRLHKKFPEILKWHTAYSTHDNGSSPYIDLNHFGTPTDEKGAPLVLAIRRLTHSKNINKIPEFAERTLEKKLKELKNQ